MSAGESPISIDLAREPDFRIGRLEVRPSTREVIAGETREVLEPRIMQVLVALSRRHGEVVSRDELIASCWGGRVVGEDAIQRAVAGVRRLGEANAAFAVETVARVGYRLVETEATRQRFWRRPRAPARAWVAAALLVVALAAGGGWLAWSRLGAPPASGEIKVAVLPFEATSSDADARHFADGLLDEILSVLSANRAEAVSRTESAALRAPDAAAIRGLGAALLLDGTVDEVGGRIKVRVHLDDAATRTILWSEDFERPATEAESLEAEVAAKATTLASYALAARSAGLTNGAVLADYISAVESYRFDWSGGSQTAEPILRRVIERAPRFAGGHAQLAVALAVQYYPGNPRAAELSAEAMREAQRALALNPRGFGAYGVFFTLKPVTDWQAREVLTRKAMAADPTEAGYPYMYSRQLALTGRLKAAAEMARRGVAIDPLWPGPTSALGMTLLEAGRPNDGLATFDRMAEIWPRHYATRMGRFWATAMYGDPDVALKLLADDRTAPPDVDPRGAALWREFLAATKPDGPKDRSRLAADLEAGERAGALASGAVTAMLARLGDIDGAFAAANRYVDQINTYGPTKNNPTTLPPYLFISATAPMRRDPRFMPLVARLGLAQFWRATGQWPDFCAEPGLPYDCKAEAAKLSVVKPQP
jgi:DNA-binding winged helix-turn-helix (wHTH) protein/TolB-like protein